MRMTDQTFAALKAACDGVLAVHFRAAEAYRNQGLTHGRFRWDVYNRAVAPWRREGVEAAPPAYRELYTLKDDHIDTALRRILWDSYPPIP